MQFAGVDQLPRACTALAALQENLWFAFIRRVIHKGTNLKGDGHVVGCGAAREFTVNVVGEDGSACTHCVQTVRESCSNDTLCLNCVRITLVNCECVDPVIAPMGGVKDTWLFSNISSTLDMIYLTGNVSWCHNKPKHVVKHFYEIPTSTIMRP